jgi:hypothetical protein
MPNLVLAVRYDGIDRRWESILEVFKRISMASLLLLLGTPLQHPVVDHAHCLRSINWGRPPFSRLHEIQPECLATPLRPSIRPLEVIGAVNIVDGGTIHGQMPDRMKGIQTSVLLHNTSLWTGLSDTEDRLATSETMIHLLKLCTIQALPAHFEVQETAKIFRADGPRCGYRRSYESFHLRVSLTEEAAMSFVDIVSVNRRKDKETLGDN